MTKQSPEGYKECDLLDYVSLVPTGVKPFVSTKKYVDTGNLETEGIVGYELVTFENKPSRANQEVRINDALFAKMKGTEKVFLISKEGEPHIFSTGFAVLRISDTSTILPKFLWYWLRTPYFQKTKDKECTGATQKDLKGNSLKKFKIVVPPLNLQKRIVAILHSAEETKELRAQADEITNQLRHGVFLEMFGDPVKNSKNFPIVALESVFSQEKEGTKCGPFGSALKKEEYVESGVPVWTMDNIIDTTFNSKGCLYISEQKYRELEAYSVEEGDIIISRAGTVGKMCVVYLPNGKSIISTNLIRLSLNKNKILPIYFTSLMTYCKCRVGRLKTGADGAYTFMKTSVLKRLKIPLPPIELQSRFTQVVGKVETMCQMQKQSQEEIDKLFNALMQKAFTGELTL